MSVVICQSLTFPGAVRGHRIQRQITALVLTEQDLDISVCRSQRRADSGAKETFLLSDFQVLGSFEFPGTQEAPRLLWGTDAGCPHPFLPAKLGSGLVSGRKSASPSALSVWAQLPSPPGVNFH